MYRINLTNANKLFLTGRTLPQITLKWQFLHSSVSIFFTVFDTYAKVAQKTVDLRITYANIISMGITKKQKAVYDFINDYTDANGLAPTQKEIKEHFDLKSFGSVQRYLKYLVDAGYLEMDWNARRGLKVVNEDESSNGQAAATEEIPLLGLIAAGNPIEALENPTDTIDVPKHMVNDSARHFALTIRGDSMINAGILEDDIVVCKASNSANQGQIAVAVVDGEATLKYYYQRADHIELKPANDQHSPIIITEGDFKIAGVLTGLVRYY